MSPSERDILRGIVVKFTGCRESALNDETLLLDDLGLHGDDVDELLQEIHKAFGTSFRELDFGMYFPNETEGGWTYRIDTFLRPSRKKKPLTFGHLSAVVERGHWFEPAE